MVGTDNISHIRRELQAVAILVTKMLLRTTRIRRVLGAGGGGTGPDVTRMSLKKNDGTRPSNAYITPLFLPFSFLQ